MKNLLSTSLQLAGLGLLSAVVLLVAFTGLRQSVAASLPTSSSVETPAVAFPTPTVSLPPPVKDLPVAGIPRLTQLHTEIPQRPTYEIRQYTVQAGDTAWSIAQKFGLRPETILWGNQWISTEAGSLQIGTTLNILPVDGVLHIVSEGDTLERIQLLHGTPIEDIVFSIHWISCRRSREGMCHF